DDNVFVVGDVKQSIYGFRQSKPEIFLANLKDAVDITEPSRKGGRVDLQDNFRCRAEIIDFVNALFGPVMTEAVADMDYDEKAELISGFDYEPFTATDGPNCPVELALLDEDSTETDDDAEAAGPTEAVSAAQRQAAYIADRIQTIVGAGTGTPEFQVYDKKTDAYRDVQYRDVVILMRSLSHKAQEYVEILRLAGVPVSSQSACGYFEATEISDCVCLLKVLDNADRDIELAAVLRGPVFGLSESALAAIRLYGGRRMSFYRAMLAYADNGPDATLKDTLAAILAQLADWRTRLRQGSLANMLDDIFREKDLLAFYAALPNGSQRRANLLKLHDHAIQFEHFRTTEPGSALGRFVEFLEKLAEAEQDWAPAEPDSAGENAVRIMSVHKSKGLEFPVVFAAELNTMFNMRDSAGECLIDEQTVGLQVMDADASGKFPSMAHQVIAERHRKANIAEEMRILYVALTRAREKLILTASKKGSACGKLLAECAAFGETIPDWRLAAARCHLDWVLISMARHGGLCDLFEVSTGQPALAESLLHAARIDRDELEAMTRKILDDKRSLTCYTTPPKPTSKAEKAAQTAFAAISAQLLWQYPHQIVTEISAKLSVSELTHGNDEFATVDASAAFNKQPAATLTKRGQSPISASALSLGTAVHAVIEHLNLSMPVTQQSISNTIQILVENGTIDAATAESIDTNAIAAFFDSDLGKLAQANAGAVLREWPFTYGLSSNDITKRCQKPLISPADTTKRGQEPFSSEEDEIVVVQGIVDMIIPTEEGLVIVDFKTDRVTEETVQQRADRYTEQLRTYAKAAGAILNRPVAAAWLYFLNPQKAIEIKLP
ncbi:MAG: 3'-5' exonuclease, partial [Planctomycetota bacterium]